MWLAGDAEHEEIKCFETVGYSRNPGMAVNVLKADHHGSPALWAEDSRSRPSVMEET